MIKGFAVVFALLVCSVSLSAQSYIFDKGVVSLGGSLGFSSTSSSVGNVTVSLLSIAPTVGYFFARNLEVGISVDYTNRSVSVELLGQKSSSSSSTTFIGPFVRYFITEGKPVLSPYVGASLGISSSGGSRSSTSFGGEVGVAYVAAKNVAILGGLDFTRIEDGSIIGLSIGVGAFLW